MKLFSKAHYKTLGKWVKKPFKIVYAKSPILAFSLLVIIGIFIVAGGSYGVYQLATQQVPIEDASLATQEKEVGQENQQLEDKVEDTHAGLVDNDEGANNLDDGSQESGGSSDNPTTVTASPTAPTATTGAGCVASACPGNPSFSISVSPSSVTVSPGELATPVTASISDGTAVDWASPNTPNEDVIGVSAYSKTADDFKNKSSIVFYVQASLDAKPGTYTLTFPGTDNVTQTRATGSFNVTVRPK